MLWLLLLLLSWVVVAVAEGEREPPPFPCAPAAVPPKAHQPSRAADIKAEQDGTWGLPGFPGGDRRVAPVAAPKPAPVSSPMRPSKTDNPMFGGESPRCRDAHTAHFPPCLPLAFPLPFLGLSNAFAWPFRCRSLGLSTAVPWPFHCRSLAFSLPFLGLPLPFVVTPYMLAHREWLGVHTLCRKRAALRGVAGRPCQAGHVIVG